ASTGDEPSTTTTSSHQPQWVPLGSTRRTVYVPGSSPPTRKWPRPSVVVVRSQTFPTTRRTWIPASGVVPSDPLTTSPEIDDRSAGRVTSASAVVVPPEVTDSAVPRLRVGAAGQYCVAWLVPSATCRSHRPPGSRLVKRYTPEALVRVEKSTYPSRQS